MTAAASSDDWHASSSRLSRPTSFPLLSCSTSVGTLCGWWQKCKRKEKRWQCNSCLVAQSYSDASDWERPLLA